MTSDSKARSLANLRPYQPGQSGNPGGRRPSLTKTVHSIVGHDGSKLVQGLVAIAFGTPADQKAIFGKPLKVSVRDRKDAIEILLDRGWGKALQAHEVTGPEGGPVQIAPVRMLERFSDDEVQTLKALAAKAQEDE